MTRLSTLFFTFARVGVFTFGGGYAMLPMLEREVVTKHAWVTQEELLNYYAISQCVPGLIAINTATFVGHRHRGLLGGIVATAGVVIPSFFIILILAALLNNFAGIPLVARAFNGIRVVVCALILNTIVKLIRSNIKSILQALILIVAFLLTAIAGLSPIFPILGAAIFGFIAGKKGVIK